MQKKVWSLPIFSADTSISGRQRTVRTEYLLRCLCWPEHYSVLSDAFAINACILALTLRSSKFSVSEHMQRFFFLAVVWRRELLIARNLVPSQFISGLNLWLPFPFVELSKSIVCEWKKEHLIHPISMLFISFFASPQKIIGDSSTCVIQRLPGWNLTYFIEPLLDILHQNLSIGSCSVSQAFWKSLLRLFWFRFIYYSGFVGWTQVLCLISAVYFIWLTPMCFACIWLNSSRAQLLFGCLIYSFFLRFWLFPWRLFRCCWRANLNTN